MIKRKMLEVFDVHGKPFLTEHEAQQELSSLKRWVSVGGRLRDIKRLVDTDDVLGRLNWSKPQRHCQHVSSEIRVFGAELGVTINWAGIYQVTCHISVDDGDYTASEMVFFLQNAEAGEAVQGLRDWISIQASGLSFMMLQYREETSR